MLDLASLFTLAMILGLGIFIQSAAGFAAGLFIVPVLLWAGYSIPEAQTSLLVATIPQNLWGVWQFRDHIERRELLFPAALRLVFLPIGMGCLVALEALPSVQLRQIVGGIVLGVTLALIVMKPTPRESLPVGWSWLAFSASGFLQGVCGMGGPAMVLWVQSHAWDTKKTRGFLFCMYLVSLLPALVSLWCFFGDRVLRPAQTAALLIPLLLVITSVGLRAGTWLGRERLKRLTLGLLVLMGLAGVFAPFISRVSH